MIKKRYSRILWFVVALLSSGSASAWCIKVPEANLRQGPGTQYEKSWEVYKYMPFQKIGQRGKWLHVKDMDGDKHWVYSPLGTSSMKCAAVKVDEANVRHGPSTRYAKTAWGPVRKYYSFAVIDTKGDWAKVRDEVLNEGWVAKSLLWIP